MSRITLCSSESHLGMELRGEEADLSGKGLVKKGPNKVLLEYSVAKYWLMASGKSRMPLWFI